MKRNPPGKPKSPDRTTIEKLLETKDSYEIKRMAKTGELAIKPAKVSTILYDIHMRG